MTLAGAAVAQDGERGMSAEKSFQQILDEMQIEEGRTAFNRGDYATALALFRPLAEQGNAFAQYNLGLMYNNGEGVPQDYAEAVRWYLLSTEQGNSGAQNNIGGMYYRGEGLPQNNAEALRWFRQSAEKGLVEAQYNLGVMYGNGRGVPQDYILAHMWWNLAAAQGNEEAVEARDIVAASMTREQIAEAQRLASAWVPQ